MTFTEIAKSAKDKIEVHYVDLEDLKIHFLDGNSKQHDVTKLIESFRRYGFRDPLTFDPTLNQGQGAIVEGNGRLEAIVKMKEENFNCPRGIIQQKQSWLVPVLFGVNAITEQEAIAYSIEHNWSVVWGSGLETAEVTSLFDDIALAAQLEELSEAGSLPISIEDNLDELIEQLQESAGNNKPSEDEVPDPDKIEPRVKRGEIWKLGRHYLYCGDSTDGDKIKEFLGDQAPTFVWADAPYGINIVGGREKQKGYVGGGNCNRTPINVCIAKKAKKLGTIGNSKPVASVVKVNKYVPVAGDDSIDIAISSYQLISAIEPRLMTAPMDQFM